MKTRPHLPRLSRFPHITRLTRLALPLRAALAALAFASAAVPAAWAQEKTSVAQLAFLTGTWRGPSSSGTTAEEIISAPEGGVMLSAGREFRGAKCVFFDLVVFAEKDGVVNLIPHPNGKRSADIFPLVKLEAAAHRATFENKAHDFPKVFLYELIAPDHLRITLTGDQKGHPAKEVFELKRTK
jgi:hypothetical protein